MSAVTAAGDESPSPFARSGVRLAALVALLVGVPGTGAAASTPAQEPVPTEQFPARDIVMLFPMQLCVPVQTDDQEIPEDVLEIVEWIDLEKYDLETRC